MTRTIRTHLSRLGLTVAMLFVAVAVIGTTSEVAFAQQQPKWKMQKEAKDAYAAGKKKEAAGDYAGALADFLVADEKWPGAAPKYNIAVCHDKLNQYAEAVAAYRTFIDSKPGAKYADRVIAAGKRISELESKLEGTVNVTVTPANLQGMTITVDGAPVAGPAIKLAPGPHTIEVTAPDHAPFSQQVEVTGGATIDLPITLQPAVVAPPPPPPSQGMSTAEILRISGFVGIGVAVVGGVLVTVFGVQALGNQSDFDATPTAELADDAESNALIADVFVGVTGAFGVAGIILLAAGYSMDDGNSESAVRVLPTAGPQGGGIVMTVDF